MTYDILMEFAAKQGWDTNSLFSLLCQYVDNQQSPDTLAAFLQDAADNEN